MQQAIPSPERTFKALTADGRLEASLSTILTVPQQVVIFVTWRDAKRPESHRVCAIRKLFPTLREMHRYLEDQATAIQMAREVAILKIEKTPDEILHVLIQLSNAARALDAQFTAFV